MSTTTAKRRALFTEGNVPPGAICLSSFVVVKNSSQILVGKMAKPEIWIDRFFVGEDRAPIYVSSGKYLVPASHLAWYESPLEAARRVMADQVLLPELKDQIRLLDVQSHVSGDPTNESEPPHWDICFVYETNVPAKIAKNLARPEWFQDFGFISSAMLTREHFTRGHGDVLDIAGVIGPKSSQRKSRGKVAKSGGSGKRKK